MMLNWQINRRTNKSRQLAKTRKPFEKLKNKIPGHGSVWDREGSGCSPPCGKQVYKRYKKMIEIRNPGWRLRWQCSRHTHWDGCSAFIASVYKCLHESASVYNSLQVSSSVYKSLQEFTKVCMRLQESASVCKCCTSINRLRFFFFQTERHNQTTE